MAGTITHSWNGTVLTITSDSGTSSADLKGAQGDMGVRGAQGIPGILHAGSEFATKKYVDDAVIDTTPDLSGYATKGELNALVPTVAESALQMANICYVSTNIAPTADIGKDGDIFVVKG
jgi:hypothetical protein